MPSRGRQPVPGPSPHAARSPCQSRSQTNCQTVPCQGDGKALWAVALTHFLMSSRSLSMAFGLDLSGLLVKKTDCKITT